MIGSKVLSNTIENLVQPSCFGKISGNFKEKKLLLPELGQGRFTFLNLTMQQPVLYFEDAGIFQEQNLVLSDVNLRLDSGEMAFLIGKTGAGKSSLLKTIYAQLELRQGRGFVLGYELASILEKEIPYLRRQLGIIFQEFHLLNDRDVYDNLDFVLRATGWRKKKERKERILEVLHQVGIAEKIHQMPFKISGGEQQRLVIARAILNKPKLIIADEPTGNLDPDTSAEIMELLIGLKNEGQAALLIATHNHQMIQKYPGRTLECVNGTLRESQNVKV